LAALLMGNFTNIKMIKNFKFFKLITFFAICLMGAGVSYWIVRAVGLEFVVDTFDTDNPGSDPEYYIASKENLVVSGGQVMLDEAQDLMCTTCTCDGTGYETVTCFGDTIYVDCNADMCWSPTAASKYNYNGAKNYCNNLVYAGKSDWFLTSRGVLIALCSSDSCSGTCFGGDGFSSQYWCSSSSGIDVRFSDCSWYFAAKSALYYVRCAHN
jgi:hypothetical protein